MVCISWLGVGCGDKYMVVDCQYEAVWIAALCVGP